MSVTERRAYVRTTIACDLPTCEVSESFVHVETDPRVGLDERRDTLPLVRPWQRVPLAWMMSLQLNRKDAPYLDACGPDHALRLATSLVADANA